MGTIAHDTPALKHQNAVSIPNGAEPVCHDERGAALRQIIQRFLNLSLTFRIQRSRSFIQNQHRSILYKRTGNRHALTLPAGKSGAPLP